MSSNGNKAVRFAQETDNGEAVPGNSQSNSRGSNSVRGATALTEPPIAAPDSSHRPLKKRKLKDRFNEDELDDVDDWKPEDDDDDDDEQAAVAVPSEQQLLQAKRKRRTQRTVGADSEEEDDNNNDTRLDNRTYSLAADGIEVEPFHMDQERTDGSGYFDGDTYVFRKRDQDDEEPDAWLEALNDNNKNGGDNNNNWDQDSSIHHNTMAMMRNEQRRQQQDDANEKMDNWTEQDLYAKLLPNLGANETVLEALVRYGNLFQPKKKNTTTASTTSTVVASPESQQLAHDSFNDITEAANALLLQGKIDIYQMKRADIEAALQQLLPKKEPEETASTTTAATVQWEYQGNNDGQIHGPYSTHEMLGWIRAGYFVGATAVQVRTVVQPAPAAANKSMTEDLLSDLMDDDDEHDRQDEPKEERGEWMLSDKVDFNKYEIR